MTDLLIVYGFAAASILGLLAAFTFMDYLDHRVERRANLRRRLYGS